MSRYSSQPGFRHEAPAKTGVLLVNLGTPDEPTTPALKRYLKEFLWDPRVVEIPRPVWWLILRIVLATRPKRSAALYRKVWMPEGSPLMVHSRRITQAVSEDLKSQGQSALVVDLAMRYGNPSIAEVLERMRAEQVRRLVVLPLYPQYSGATAGSTFDRVSQVLSGWRWTPDLTFIDSYHAWPGYIDAMAERVRRHWAEHGRSPHLLLSFHGMPRRTLDLGDPYHCQCQVSARLLAESLGLGKEEWTLAFQSRFGRAEWLKPYTSDTLKAMAKRGVREVDVFCPGFSADCLETLEEIAMQNAEIFHEAGGQTLRYIPALNDSVPHVQALGSLIASRLPQPAAQAADEPARSATLARAQALGAKQ